jgi:hypothetical protein
MSTKNETLRKNKKLMEKLAEKIKKEKKLKK